MAVITISRQYGSGGDDIAARVCDLLGYSYFDKVVMAQVAEKVGLSEKEMIDFSEENYKVDNFLQSIFHFGPRVVAERETWQESADGERELTVEKFDEVQCLDMIQNTIRAAYKHGDMVIVGRGGQAILQDMPGVLHVRIESPMVERISRIMARKPNLSLAEVDEIITKKDRAASQYLGRLFGIRWGDSMLYHIVINTGKVRIEESAQAIAHLVQQLQAK